MNMKPYTKVGIDAAEAQTAMADAGADTSTFHQHSTRTASAAWLRSSTNKKMSVTHIYVIKVNGLEPPPHLGSSITE